MEEKFVVRGCPYLSVAHYAPGDTVEDQCALTEYELCADRENCILKRVAEAVTSDDVEKCKDILQIGYTTISFKK